MAASSSRRRAATLWVALVLTTGAAAPARALPNYIPFKVVGWESPLVLRTTPDATLTTAVNSPTLAGEDSTYFNRGQKNSSPDPGTVPITNANYVDGNVVSSSVRQYAAFQSLGSINFPVVVHGGLHTAGMGMDITNADAESDETDNTLARQVSFTPVDFPLNTIATRVAPPLPLGGTTPVVGTIYNNQDGLRLPANASPWEAVALRPPFGEDYDLSLYDATTVTTDGFRVPLKTSNLGNTRLDFILNNGNFVGAPPHDVGVTNFSGTAGSYSLEHRQSSGVFLVSGGTYSGLTLAANQMLDVRTFQHIPNVSAPRMLIELTATPAQVLHVALFDAGATYASRSEALADVATDAAGRAVLDRALETTGGPRYYAVVVYRDEFDGGLAAATYSLRVRATPPDLANIPQPGKTTPMNASNGASNWTTDPVALDGNTANTNMSFYFTNTGAQTATTYRMDTRLDGQSVLPFSPGAIAPNATIYQAVAPINVRGGRHTLSYVLDLDGAIDETSETNNQYGRQFVWSPLVMSAGTTYVRPLPPDPAAGLDALPTGVSAYWNCDGLRTDPTKLGGPLPLANVVAVLPQAGADVDLDAFALSTGPLDGFATPLTTSQRNVNLVDLVANCNESATQPMDVGVRKFAGATQAFAVQNVFSTWNAAVDPPTIGPDVLPSGTIVKAFSFQRNVHPTMTVILDNLSGDADLGMSVYQYDSAGPHPIDGTLPGGYVDAVGPGISEGTVVTTTGGQPYFVIVVWKKAYTEFAKTANFRLRIDPVTADVTPAIPHALAFAIAGDNPAAGATKLRFDLPRAAAVSLDVLDLQGRHVRTLASGVQPAGSHTLPFDGLDESGARLRNGAYFVRFSSGSFTRVEKLVMLR